MSVTPLSPSHSQPKTVLIVSYLFPPVGGIAVQRSLKFTRYLQQHGWRVVVLTATGVYSATMDPSLEGEIPSDVAVFRPVDPISKWVGRAVSATTGDTTETSGQLSGFFARLKSTIRRSLKRAKDFVLVPDEAVAWVARAAIVGAELVRQYNVDCVFTTSGPNSAHLTGWFLKRFTGAKWVADFRDPWTDNMHFQREGLRKRIELWMEASVFRRADAITTVTSGFEALFGQRYVDARPKIEVIRNGVDPNDFPALSATPRSERCTLFYAGILYPKRSPAPFFQALNAALRYGQLKPSDIRVQFAGVFDYPGQSHNRDLVHQLGLQSVVEVLGYLPHDEVLRHMMRADGLLLIGEQSAKSNIYVPGKLYEYLYAGKPILGLLQNGEAASLIREANAGVVLDPLDWKAISSAIVKQVDAFKRGVPFQPDQQQLARHTRQSQAKQLASLMDRLTATVPCEGVSSDAHRSNGAGTPRAATSLVSQGDSFTHS